MDNKDEALSPTNGGGGGTLQNEEGNESKRVAFPTPLNRRTSTPTMTTIQESSSTSRDTITSANIPPTPLVTTGESIEDNLPPVLNFSPIVQSNNIPQSPPVVNNNSSPNSSSRSPSPRPTLGRRQSRFRRLANKVKEERAAASAAAAAAFAKNGGSSVGSEKNLSNFKKTAELVVETQRAAKGFTAMWARERSQTQEVSTDAMIYGIHLEKKKLDLKQVSAEYKEVKRSQFYQELVVYIVFLTVFYLLLGWLPVYDAFEQSDVVRDLLCTDAKTCDIGTIDDIYDFAEHAQQRICTVNSSFVNYQRWTKIGQVRLRQVRVAPASCDIASGWNVDCFPPYSEAAEDTEPIYGLDNRVYFHKSGMSELDTWLQSRFLSWFSTSSESDTVSPGSDGGKYGTGGYLIDLCRVESIDWLRDDKWISMATRAISLEFTLVNPATQIFTIGYHIFTISASGHVRHFPQGANVRLASSSSTSSDRQHSYPFIDVWVILWLCAVGFFLTYVRAEVSEMAKMGMSSYIKTDNWNAFELIQLYVLGVVLYNIFLYYVQSKVTLLQLQDLKRVRGPEHISMQPLLSIFQRLIDYASVGSAISLLKVFKFLRMNSTLNLLWQVLGMAIKDLFGFLIIFNLIFLSYSSMGSLAFGFALEEFSTLTSSYATCFQMLAGDFDYAQLHQANPRVAPLFFGSFVVLVFQILVNMFVAILSEYYEVAKDNIGNTEDIEYDVFNRFNSYLESCAPHVVLHDKHEPLELYKGQTVRLISTNLVDKEVGRQRARKLFRGAVWRVVALLRLGVRFDRLLNIGPRTASKAKLDSSTKVLYIPLSGNFDHKTIKDMLPKGISVRLQGDLLLGSDVLLQVTGHSSLSIECQVLGSNVPAEEVEGDEESLELLGGESLRIPWHFFALHVLRTIAGEFRIGILRAMKFWDPKNHQLVDDYHLSRLLNDAKLDGRSSLRFDELYRILDLYMRKDQHSRDLVTQDNVRHETAAVMYRFRKSLIDMPSREKEGYDYKPSPIDTSKIEIGSLEHLSEMLAENCHDLWAIERIKQGWVYGESRGCGEKTHPNLVPFEKLPKDEQDFDYRTTMETLKTILSLNYQIVRSTNPRSMSSQISDDEHVDQHLKRLRTSSSNLKSSSLIRRYSTGEESSTSAAGGGGNSSYFVQLPDGSIYTPQPAADTSKVTLPSQLTQLVDLLAENAHEVWSKGRMDLGWKYGTNRDDKLKLHPCLVPYIFLTDEEKEYDITTAMGTLKMMQALNFNVIDRENR